MTASILQRIQREISRFEATGIVPLTRVTSGPNGNVRTAQVGQGDDFHAFDRYRVGDDVRMVDWQVYARTRRLWSKRFSQTRTKQLLLALDGSGSMQAGSEEKWIGAVECALILQGLCIRNGFETSIIVLGERGIERTPSVMDGTSIQHCLNWLLHYRCRGVERIDSIGNVAIDTAGELCLISDFMWQDVLRDLKMIDVTTNFILTCIRVSSTVDTTVPSGAWFDPQTFDVANINETPLVQHRLDLFRNEVEVTCGRRGNLFIDWSVDDHTEALKEWIARREIARLHRVPG